MTDSGHSNALRLPKKERLSSKKEIEELFKNGSSFYLHPLLLKYQQVAPAQTGQAVLFSVSRKKFKRAVDRNLIKRRMREAYRINQLLLKDEVPPGYRLAFVYLDKTILPFSIIEPKLKSLMLRLQKRALKNQSNAPKGT
ncbi:ribonuclease P protein component [Marinoscillum furvescens]|uniref:Ribonuclease P protein component n=1 Tax=Marinoscillum furvescens DSM 4134 TaxID=1122208 RepID=A0A3D9KZP2_MARFU|nr:ribonuclease P protein component [Marinoscillum furvescens]RED93595.1 ribonuclease P protein component [Marinoscillum furvescens DSM 4134]